MQGSYSLLLPATKSDLPPKCEFMASLQPLSLCHPPPSQTRPMPPSAPWSPPSKGHLPSSVVAGREQASSIESLASGAAARRTAVGAGMTKGGWEERLCECLEEKRQTFSHVTENQAEMRSFLHEVVAVTTHPGRESALAAV